MSFLYAPMSENCDVGPRIASWLRQAYPKSRTKSAARDFGVSERQVQRWAAGCSPAPEHLAAMARLWGWEFVSYVFEGVIGAPAPAVPSTEEIHQRLDRIEQQMSQLLRGYIEPHAPSPRNDPDTRIGIPGGMLALVGESGAHRRPSTKGR